MAARILLADDDELLVRMVGFALEEAGHSVTIARDGLEALEMARQGASDLLILDVMMPRMDGWEVCRRARELLDIPILMLTARDSERDRLRGLRGGADVYLTKPFAVSVLIAQVDALLRRSRSTVNPLRPTTIEVGDLRIDLAMQDATLGERPIELTPTEFRLLAALASRAGEVISHRELLAEVWGPQYSEEEDYLKLYIWYLRQKIEVDPHRPRRILTKRGRGYYLHDGPPSPAAKGNGRLPTA